MTASITVYTQTVCQPCRMTKMKLDQLGLAYDVVNVDLPENEAAGDQLRAEGWMATPVVKVEGAPTQSWSGYRPDLLDALAARLK